MAKNEYVVKIDNSQNFMTYLPINNRIALIKKKKSQNIEQQGSDLQNANFMIVAPRIHTQKELQKKIES